jgi:predicted Zn-dependent peptidase
MFMGTERVPGSGYDDIMEAGGGANNASTGMDRTNYYVWGPSSLLPTLLWLDADRLEGLDKAMTQEKLDLQREVVLNERRQNYENTPYNKAYLIIPRAIYPSDHPYHRTGIGEPEDLNAATLEDVIGFFETYYVPGNASVVIAGDFDSDAVKQLLATTFGAVPAKPMPERPTVAPVVLDGEIRRLDTDRVEFGRLYLVWPSPAYFEPGDAEMDLIASILADGPSSRLYDRLVAKERLAQDVAAFQASQDLGSLFYIEATAVAGGDLEKIKRIVLEEIERLATEGPTEQEVARVQAAQEASFLRGVENLNRRADKLNDYYRHFGVADGFARDLARWIEASPEDLQSWAAKVFTDGRLDLRILPADGTTPVSALDTRPDDFEARDYLAPQPESFVLSNGIEVSLVTRRGSGLFSGALIVDGGERNVSADRAGLADLTATMLTSGAGGRSAFEYADAVAALGADVSASAGSNTMVVRVRGLTSQLDPTLDLFADAVLRPNLHAEDFDRERELALEAIRGRSQNANAVAFLTGRAVVFGTEDPRGRPVDGFERTVEGLDLALLKQTAPTLINPAAARFVFVGDMDAEPLKGALESRFGKWRSESAAAAEAPAEMTATEGRMVMVDRPDAPQTVIYIMRPVPAPENDVERTSRRLVNTLFGWTFTSRLMRNLREEHGYTYGARSQFRQRGTQYQLYAFSAVQSDVTAAALGEFEKEFNALATGDITTEELSKASSTVRYELTNTAETTSSLAQALIGLASNGRPMDSVARGLASLDEVDLDRANQTARSGLFSWEDFVIVLVGDTATVIPQLEEAGFETPELVDMEGRVIE